MVQIIKVWPGRLVSSPATGSLRPAFAPRAGRPFCPQPSQRLLQTPTCKRSYVFGRQTGHARQPEWNGSTEAGSAVTPGRRTRGGPRAVRDSVGARSI